MQCQDRNCGGVIGVAGEYLRLVRNMYLDIRTVYAVSLTGSNINSLQC